MREIKPYLLYSFKVRASNKCGSSRFSTEGLIDTKMAPSSLKWVRFDDTSLDSCSANLSWSRPEDDGGSPLTEYILELESRNGTSIRLQECGVDPDATSCAVNLMSLAQPPFNLLKDHEIKIRARAVNKVGSSLPTVRAPSTFKIVERPALTAMNLTSMGDNSVSLKWDQL